MNTTQRQDELSAARVDGALGFWEIARAQPDRIAVVDPARAQTTFGDLLGRADAIACELLDLGFRPGESVAVLMRNEPLFVAVQLATSQIGLYLTAINWHLSVDEVTYIVRDSDARALFTGSEADLAGTATAAADAAGLAAHCRFASSAIPGFRDASSLPERDVDPAVRQQGMSMLYTSGTTGRPKGVRKENPKTTPEAAVAESIPGRERRHGIKPGPGVHAVVAPLYHAAPNGFAISALHMGRPLILFDKWNPEGFLEVVEKYRVTDTHMVPTMFHRLLALPAEVRTRYDVSSLEAVVHAAAPCPVHEKWAMLEWWGPILFEYYSATEGGGTSVTAQEWVEHPGTVGRVWPGAEIKILDAEGRELPAGEIGGIYIRNSTSFEYYKDPAKTAEAREGDFFTAGDVGYFDEDGWLYLSDRRSDLIISGGVNIYPAEVEAVLLTHPAVMDAGVIGVPDREWGATVHAVVEPAAGREAGDALASELLEHCKSTLARFKCPRTLEFRVLPRTPTGKLSRAELRASIVGDSTRPPNQSSPGDSSR